MKIENNSQYFNCKEKYCSLISNYYRNASLAIIVYSVDNLKSFKDIDFWIKELKSNSSPDIKLMLIGNKKDLIEERQVQYDEGKKIANDYGFYYFSETIYTQELVLLLSVISWKSLLIIFQQEPHGHGC